MNKPIKNENMLSQNDLEALRRMGITPSTEEVASGLTKKDRRFLLSLIGAVCLVFGVFIFALIKMSINTLETVDASSAVEPKSLSSLPFDTEVVSSFNTQIPGLVGWHVKSREAGENIIYSSANGDYTIIGVVLDQNGENITEKEMVEHLGLDLTTQTLSEVSPEDTKRQIDFVKNKLVEGLGVSGKNSDKTVWAVIDVNCPYCHELIKELDSLLAEMNEHASVELVTACVLGPNSCAQESLLKELAPEDRMLALVRHVHGEKGVFGTSSEEELLEKSQQLLRNAQQFMEQGISAVPTILWVDDEGNAMSHTGLPARGLLKAILAP